MNKTIYLLAIGLFVVCGNVMAACPTPASDKTAVLNAVQNKAICIFNNGDWEAQEYHQSATANGGNLIDYKKGPNDSNDPTENIGSWVVNDNGTITYNYSGGQSFTNTVKIDGNNVCLDNGTTTLNGTIQAINITTPNSGCQ